MMYNARWLLRTDSYAKENKWIFDFIVKNKGYGIVAENKEGILQGFYLALNNVPLVHIIKMQADTINAGETLIQKAVSKLNSRRPMLLIEFNESQLEYPEMASIKSFKNLNGSPMFTSKCDSDKIIVTFPDKIPPSEENGFDINGDDPFNLFPDKPWEK